MSKNYLEKSKDWVDNPNSAEAQTINKINCHIKLGFTKEQAERLLSMKHKSKAQNLNPLNCRCIIIYPVCYNKA